MSFQNGSSQRKIARNKSSQRKISIASEKLYNGGPQEKYAWF